MELNTRYLCQAALIAAVYTVLSLLFLPISFGPIQCRISEMLVVLPAIMPAAVPGVTVGCLLTNILGGAILPDIVFGTLATLIGALLTRKLTRGACADMLKTLCHNNHNDDSERPGLSPALRILAAVPPVVSNTVIVPLVLKYAYAYDDALYFMAFTVCIGEIISAALLGNLLLTVLCRRNVLLKLRELGAAD